MKRIETARLYIREYGIEDLPALHEILSDEVTMSFWPRPFNYEESEAWIKNRGIANYHNGYGRFAVELKETGEMIGDAGLLRLEAAGEVENDLGYIIKSNHWGRGFGYEAANALMIYGFNELNLQRICANMPTTHNASRKVAEKLGMKLEKQFLNTKNRDLLTCLYVKSITHRIWDRIQSTEYDQLRRSVFLLAQKHCAGLILTVLLFG